MGVVPEAAWSPLVGGDYQQDFEREDSREPVASGWKKQDPAEAGSLYVGFWWGESRFSGTACGCG